MKERYYIVGCARSGTTLLRRLFNAFHGLVVYNHDEINLDDFVAGEWDVGKRKRFTAFSDRIAYEEFEDQLAFFKKHNIRTVYIERKREAVLASAGGIVSPERYDACVSQARHFGVDFQMHFEMLLEFPDEEQRRLARHFGFELAWLWSRYHEMYDGRDEKPGSLNGNYAIRPLGQAIQPVKGQTQ